MTGRIKRLYGVLGLLLVFAIALNLYYGTYQMDLADFFSVWMNRGSVTDTFIIFSLRLPRVLIVLLAGAALALSGSILQSITHNDLADPGIIGINAGAGLGVTVFFLMFSHSAKDFAILLPLAAFLGAALTAFMIMVLSRTKGGGIHPLKMILVGIGFSMALSGFMVILISSAERTDVSFIAGWLAGTIWGGDWPFVVVTAPLVIAAATVLYFHARTLNVVQLGENSAIGLGVNLKRTHHRMMALSTLLAAVAVSVAGNIAFLGLVAPHIAKRLTGMKNEVFLPLSALIGSMLLLFADLIARNLVEPNGMPTGIIIALIGAPYFISLLIRRSKGA